MSWLNWKKVFLGTGLAAAALVCAPKAIEACTRCVYLGPKDTVVVARSMDWAEDPGTNLYAFPKGMKRNGASGPGSLEWTSKYGSVVCASDYGQADGSKPLLSIAGWAQYALDSYSSVAEAVEALRKEPFVILAPTLPNGAKGHGHLSLSDPTGDSALFEYVAGKLVIHHGRKYQVMTNSPTFDDWHCLS